VDSLELAISRTNANIFLREFSFSRTKFSPTPRTELEFADHVVILDGTWALFQLKRRQTEESTEADPARWFHRKVITAATRQIRDTLGFLEGLPQIVVTNDRGHSFNIAANKRERVFKVVVFDPGAGTVPLQFPQFHRSHTAGFIHLIDARHYVDICDVLVTPSEIWEYLEAREAILERGEPRVSEAALLGQFVDQAVSQPSDASFAGVLVRLLRDDRQFDMRFLTAKFPERTYRTIGDNPLDYYRILSEVARLNRADLRAFKERISLCIEVVRRDEFAMPYRFVSLRTGCAFVFVPCTLDQMLRRLNALQNLTTAAKYDLKCDRAIGVVVARDGSDFLMDWALVEHPWVKDDELDELLRANYPFRPVREVVEPRYKLIGPEGT